jgi:hypothetical protein
VRHESPFDLAIRDRPFLFDRTYASILNTVKLIDNRVGVVGSVSQIDINQECVFLHLVTVPAYSKGRAALERCLADIDRHALTAFESFVHPLG